MRRYTITVDTSDSKALAYIERLERECDKRGYVNSKIVVVLNVFGKLSEIAGSNEPLDVLEFFIKGKGALPLTAVELEKNVDVVDSQEDLSVLKGLDVSF